MNARSLCLILTLFAAGMPLDVEAQTPKPNAPTKPAPAAAAEIMQLRQEFSSEFQYTFISKEKSSPPAPLPTPANGIVALPISQEYKTGWQLEIQDTTHGDIARFPIKTTGITPFNESSFKWVRVFKVPVTSGGKPVTGVSVAVSSEDSSFRAEHTLDADDAGTARFNNVPLNQQITVKVSFGSDKLSQSNTITRGHAPDGYTWSSIELDWKNLKTVAAPAVPANSGTVPTATTAGSVNAPTTLPQTIPTAPAASGGGLGGILNTLISLGLLAGIAYGLYWAYQNGKIKTLLEKLGINTATLTTPDAGAVAANPFQKSATPVQPISDGTADPFASGTVGVVPSAPVGSGLRLVATMGTYAGQIYPVTGGTIEIGRDTTNAIPLPNDTNASRRHATLQLNGAQVIVTDNGSSNGTFINGVRIATQTPTPLNPRDELTVGNTRFRFEA